MDQEQQADGTVFIDNLPKDEQSLRQMLKEVNMHITSLEAKYFEEEDSETERELQKDMDSGKMNSEQHDRKL